MSIFWASRLFFGLRWRRNPRALPLWERSLLAFYIGLLGLVMPFICWGAYAEPGHPHARPHFVFMDPVMDMPSIPMTLDHAASPSTHMSMPMDPAPATQPANSAPVGRSTPQLLLFALMVLLVGALWQIVRIDKQYLIHIGTALFAKPPRLNVPTPPPRFAF
ncbi:MAG: hypothetical protein R2911_27715 [Caldilineaceae bacterium]